MQSPRCRALKHSLSNYRFYERRVAELNDSIQRCYDRLGGIRSPRLDGVRVNSPPDYEREQALLDELDRLKSLKEKYRVFIHDMDEILDILPEMERSAIIRVWVDGETVEAVADSLFYHPSSLRYRMNKAIERAFEKGG